MSVLRSAAVMGVATFISRIMGLLREQVFAHMFGAGNAVDAFNIAFRIPNLLRDLFAEGAMSAALVPTFTRVREQQGPARAWSLAFRVFKVLFGTVTVIAAIGMVYSDQLVGLYAGAFRGVPGKFELAVSLTRVLFPFFPLVALAAAFMAVLNASGVFFMPAFASALFNLASVGTGVLGAWWFGSVGMEPIYGMAVGVVIGGGVQAFCQWPEISRLRRADLGQSGPMAVGPWYRDPDLRSMLLLMAPGTMGLAATQVSILVNSMLATSAGPGAVSWLNYAFRLMQFPIGVFGVSLAQATLPRVSTHWARSEHQQASETIRQSLLQVFAINLPAAAGLAALAVPLISLLFEHGRFGALDTSQTALALAAYSLGLAAYSGVKVLVPVFYAFGTTRVPVISSLMSVGITVMLNLMTVRLLGFWGLALGTSISAFVNLGYLLFSVRTIVLKKEAQFSLFWLFRRFCLHAFLASVMGGACLWSWNTFGWFLGESFWFRAFALGLYVAEGAAVVLIGSRILGLDESREVFSALSGKVLARMKRKFSKKTV